MSQSLQPTLSLENKRKEMDQKLLHSLHDPEMAKELVFLPSGEHSGHPMTLPPTPHR